MKTIREHVVEQLGWIRNRALKYYRDKEKAEDLASETITECLLNESRYDMHRDFRPWVSRIMHNKYLDRCRIDILRRMLPINEIDIAAPDYSDTDIAMSLLIKSLRRLRRESVCIDAVYLYAMGYTYKEISQAFSIPVGTVSRRVKDGRELIARRLNVSKC